MRICSCANYSGNGTPDQIGRCQITMGESPAYSCPTESKSRRKFCIGRDTRQGSPMEFDGRNSITTFRPTAQILKNDANPQRRYNPKIMSLPLPPSAPNADNLSLSQ